MLVSAVYAMHYMQCIRIEYICTMYNVLVDTYMHVHVEYIRTCIYIPVHVHVHVYVYTDVFYSCTNVHVQK